MQKALLEVPDRYKYTRHGLLILTSLYLASCTSLTYYLQAASGQMEIFHKQRSIPDVISRQDTDPVIKEKLKFVQNILDFARKELMLPNHGSYRTYARIDRKYVVWNVFATPEFSVKAKQWCYLFAGCLSYRGYFDEARAYVSAKKLKESGWDVYVAGVSAYSTLGWFRDPVLNTMLDRENWEIARLVFHELAHQKIYINNDVDFNEAFADSVARIGLMRWLEGRPLLDKERISTLLSHEDEVYNLILRYRDRLSRLYLLNIDDDVKRERKILLFDKLQNDYEALRQNWGNDHRYDSWIKNDMNNAKLAAVSTYRRLVPYFINLFRASGKDLRTFYALVTSLSHCEQEQRREFMLEYPKTEIHCP